MKFTETILSVEPEARVAPKPHRTSRSGRISLVFFLFGVVAAMCSTGCTGAAGSHLVTLNWNPATAEVTAYNVYRADHLEGHYTRVQTVPAPAHQYVDMTVQAGDTYYYVVTSVGHEGLESEDSIQVVARVP